MRLCIALPQQGRVTETFIAAHIDRLPHEKFILTGFPVPDRSGDGRLLLRSNLSARLFRTLWETRHQKSHAESSVHFLQLELRRFLIQSQIDVVLAEYGQTGAALYSACLATGTPLVVHFHGADASDHSVLNQYKDGYRQMFKAAKAVIAVSREMYSDLSKLGVPDSVLHYSTYGIDSDEFHGANPESSPPHFLSVGRFVEKKAPHLTLLAFRKALEEIPEARLTMVGDGPLLAVCKELANALDICDAIDFRGELEPAEVANLMRVMRGFVQHSVTSQGGDKEGTPLAIMEAGCSGLPVISTRHAGIPDVVIHGETGLLCEERDVDAMANAMKTVARDAAFAARLGKAASSRIRTHFHIDQSIDRLNSILTS